MEITPNLLLPYIAAAQSQKHVTHNEAIRALDAIVQLAVRDRNLAAAPAAPADGDRYIVAASATGLWSGQAGNVAAYQDGAWAFHAPREGWVAWVADEDVLVAWSGTAWVGVSGGGGASLNPVAGGLVGVNATADTTNRLAIASPASLFNHDGAGHQQKINKAAAADTASQLYQTAFSGRAEIGLTGDDNFHFKVSPDGASWKDAMQIDKSSGVVTLPFTPLGSVAPNLLVNGDFAINQRGFAGGALSSGTFGFDRWKGGSSGASVSISGNTVTLASGSIAQVVEPGVWGYANLASTAITVSVDTPSASITVTVGSNSGTITAGSGRRSVTVTTSSGDTGNITINLSVASSTTFGRVKAEFGTSATAWQARPATAELALCQRYFNAIIGSTSSFFGTGGSPSATLAILVVQFPVVMRAAPSLSYSSLAHWNVRNFSNNANYTVTANHGVNFSAVGGAINVGVASGLTAGSFISLIAADSAARIHLSAEL